MKTLLTKFRKNVVAGFFLIVPLVITIWVVNLFFGLLTESVAFGEFTRYLFKLMPESLRDYGPEIWRRAVALICIIIALFFMGLLTRNLVGRRLYALGDSMIGKIPGISKVYAFVRGVSESIIAQRDTMFQEVVVVEYPRKGLYSLAFVTAPVQGEVAQTLSEQSGSTAEMVFLFVPTTPNPTSGILIMVPRADVTPLNIAPADAMKLIISAGVASPDQRNPGETLTGRPPPLLEKLDHWISKDTADG